MPATKRPKYRAPNKKVRVSQALDQLRQYPDCEIVLHSSDIRLGAFHDLVDAGKATVQEGWGECANTFLFQLKDEFCDPWEQEYLHAIHYLDGIEVNLYPNERKKQKKAA